MNMVSNITDEQRKKYEDYLSKAEPYTEEELAQQEYDSPFGLYDLARMKATFAKKALDDKLNNR